MQRRAAVLFSALLLPVILFTAWLALAGGTRAAPMSGEEDAWRCWTPDPQPADPCGRAINDIQMLSPSAGWAVGDRGLLLHWNGTVWTAFPAPVEADLFDVHLLGPDTGWAAGGSETTATILSWDGVGWQEVATPPAGAALQAVDGIAADDIWAAGGEVLLRWDGVSWQDIPVGGIGYPGIQDLEVVAADDIWLTAGGADLLHWNGTDFITHTMPAPGSIVIEIDAVAPDDIWARGDYGGLWRWNGLEWRAVDVALPEYGGFDDIHMLAPDAGWAIAGNGTSLVYQWNGSEWARQSRLNARADTLLMMAGGSGWAGGWAGEMYRWNGSDWQGDADLPLHLVRSLDAVAPDEVWATGRQNYIFRYDGAVWHEMPVPTAGTGWLTIEMAGADDGWAVGYDTDGPVSLHWDGLTWKEVAIPRTVWEVEIVSADDVWAISNDGFVHWDGSSWTAIPFTGDADPALAGLAMRSADDGWAVGRDEDSGNTLLLHWDGTIWSEVTADLGDELLSDVEIVSATEVWIAGRGSFYYYNGVVWAEVPRPTRLYVNDIEMIDRNSGWAVGDGGLILSWDGVEWSLAESPTFADLGDLVVLADGSAWVAPSDYTAFTSGLLRWNGRTWSQVGAPVSPQQTNLAGLAFEPGGSGWAVGNKSRPFGSKAAAFRWDGTAWLPAFFPSTEAVVGIDAVAADDAWAIDAAGTPFHWDGDSWSSFSLSYPIFSPLFVGDVAMSANGTAWILESGRISRWTGSEWERTPHGSAGYLLDIEILPGGDVWAVGTGGTVLQWNGTNWISITVPFTGDLRVADAAAADEIWLLAGDIVHRWNGTTWSAIDLPFSAVTLAANTPDDAWVSSAQVRAAHWDGSAWTESGVPPLRRDVFDPVHRIAFAAEGTPWMSGSPGLRYFGSPPAFSEHSLYLPILTRD